MTFPANQMSRTSTLSLWFILKSFLNNKKIPCIPLFHENKFVVDYKEKAELFHSSFAKQCSIIKIDSKLPHEILTKTTEHLSDASFTVDYIAKTINYLDPEKTHENDIISICMLKNCATLFLNNWN